MRLAPGFGDMCRVPYADPFAGDNPQPAARNLPTRPQMVPSADFALPLREPESQAMRLAMVRMTKFLKNRTRGFKTGWGGLRCGLLVPAASMALMKAPAGVISNIDIAHSPSRFEQFAVFPDCQVYSRAVILPSVCSHPIWSMRYSSVINGRRRIVFSFRIVLMMRLTVFGRFALVGSDGETISLKSKKAIALLAYLALSPDCVRSREEIMALLWSDRGEGQARASLRQTLFGLKKALEGASEAALKTAGDSISLNTDFVTVEKGDGELLSGFHLSDPAFEEWLRDERQMRVDPVANGQIEHSADEKPSIIVLPFANLSGDPQQDYFSDGLTIDVTNQLSRFRSLFVIGSATALEYKRSNPSVRDITCDLGVGYVAKGSVQKADNRVRISVEIVECETGQQLWSERYDREMEDIFALQDEVAGQIVSTIAGQVEDRSRQHATFKHANDLAAYELILLGEDAQRESTKEGIQKARKLFLEAIDKDPDNARAHACVARTFLDEIWSFWSVAREAAAEQAFFWAQKAVSLDGLDNRARANLGVAYYHARGDFNAANIQFSKALELNPNDSDTNCLQGWCHVLNGEANQAIKCTDSAMRFDPLFTYDCKVAQFAANYIAERYDTALDCLGRIDSPGIEIEAFRAACYAKLGRRADAEKAMDAFMKGGPGHIEIWPGDDPDEWREFWRNQFPFKDSGNFENLMKGFRDAGLPV